MSLLGLPLPVKVGPLRDRFSLAGLTLLAGGYTQFPGTNQKMHNSVAHRYNRNTHGFAELSRGSTVVACEPTVKTAVEPNF